MSDTVKPKVKPETRTRHVPNLYVPVPVTSESRTIDHHGEVDTVCTHWQVLHVLVATRTQGLSGE